MVTIALIPLAGALLLPALPIGAKGIRRYSTCLTLLTSACAWAYFLFAKAAPLTLFALSDRYVCRFSLDGMGRLYLLVASVLWPPSALYAAGYMHDEREKSFFAYYLLAYATVILLGCADNLFTLYICFELLTLSTVPLVMHAFNKASFRAARTYLTYLFGGGALALTGIAAVSRAGACDFAAGGSLAGAGSPAFLRAMFLLCFFGFGAKAAVFPLSKWLPDASVAPTPVTALLHAVAVVNAGVYCVARAAYCVFGQALLAGSAAQKAALGAAVFTLVWAGVMAVREQHLKKRLAWSTVANLSYMLGAALLMTEKGLEAALTHMVFHSLMKLVLFFGAGAVIVHAEREYLYDVPGLGRRMPVTFACFTLAGLALTGVPPLAGFLSKYRLVTAGFAAGDAAGIAFAASVLLSGVLCALYILPIPIDAWSLSGRTARTPVPAGRDDADARMLAPMAFVSALVLAVSLYPAPVLRLVSSALEVTK